jgi:hypothetical protein
MSNTLTSIENNQKKRLQPHVVYIEATNFKSTDVDDYLSLFDQITWFPGEEAKIYLKGLNVAVTLRNICELKEKLNQPLPIDRVKIFYPNEDGNPIGIVYPFKMSFLQIFDVMNDYYKQPISNIVRGDVSRDDRNYPEFFEYYSKTNLMMKSVYFMIVG